MSERMYRPPSSLIHIALTALVALVGLADTALAQDKLDRALREGRRSGKAQRVILKAKPGYDAWARKLLAERNKQVDAELPSVGGFAVELAASELDAFCNSSVFDSCSEDATVRPTAAAKSPSKSSRERGNDKSSRRPEAPAAVYHAKAVNTLLATLGLEPDEHGGAGVTVALIDSGLYPSPAFGNRIKAFYDFTNGGVPEEGAV